MKTIYNVYLGEFLISEIPLSSNEEVQDFIAQWNEGRVFPDDLRIESEDEKTWEDFMPSYVSLYNISQDSSLNGHVEILQECISQNNNYPICERIDEWWDFPERYYLDEIRKKMEDEELYEMFDEHYDEILGWLWEHDESTPVKDLLGNTSTMACFYDLGRWIGEPYGYRRNDVRDQTRSICGTLGIDYKSEQAKMIKEIVMENSYGGYLRIYFPADFDKLLNYKKKEDDYKQIHFKGTFMVAIHNPTEGCGGYREVELDLKLPFKRDNIFMSEVERYSIESVCGFFDDWSRNLSEPEFSYELETRKRVRESDTQKVLDRENKYKIAFKNGGCTFGDTDMDRHRDVYYENSFPCGWHCPHCGQFWID